MDCLGDGLDSNGALNLLGGDITVLSMQGGGDNSPLDADGAITLNGATVFAAGSQGMGVNISGSNQKTVTSTSSYNAGTVINITSGGSVLASEKLVRRISYLLYSSPTLTSGSVSTGSSVDNCKSNAPDSHSYDNGTVVSEATADSTGLIKYTCSDCNKVEYKTIPKLYEATEYTESEEEATTEPTTQAATKAPTLTYTRKSVSAGSSFTLAVKNEGSNNVTYTSSNTKVAKVSSKGVVTALQRGTAIIKVKVGSKTLSCKVTVTNNPVIKRGKTYLSQTKTYTIKQGKTYTFKLYRKASSIKNTYTSSNSKVAKITSAKTSSKLTIKALKKGTTTIKVKVNGVKTFKIKVKVV